MDFKWGVGPQGGPVLSKRGEDKVKRKTTEDGILVEDGLGGDEEEHRLLVGDKSS